MATNKRARELERERLRRQAQRRAQEAARQRRIALTTGIVVFVAAIGSVVGLVIANRDSSKKPAAATATPAAEATGGTPVCHYATTTGDSAGKNPGLPPDTKASGAHTATIALAQGAYAGTVTLALNADKAPCTVNSFQWLASKNFFDGTTCHRETATTGLFVLQCGDPTATGSGGPGYKIPDENLDGATYKAGTVAMANSGPNTGGSQFFIVYKDSQLPASYTPFGMVTNGQDVLDKIAAVGQNNANGTGDGAPNTPVTITSFTIS